MSSSFVALIISFITCIILCPLLIPQLRRLKFGQYIREEGPKSHQVKAGTPTMGGLIFFIAYFIGVLPFIFKSDEVMAITFVMLCYGLIGFLDDYIKVVLKRNLGLKAYQKIIGQLFITTFFIVFLLSQDATALGLSPTEIIIPFTTLTINLNYLFIPFVYITTLATVNGVNFTDGLDGLCAGVTVIIAMFFAVIAAATGSETLPASMALIGALLGFLIFNSYPAKVFMGDVGAFLLGGYVACVALILNMPLFILIVGIIYVLEVMSVVIQVTYYKRTQKRIFKMAPLHHHFEHCGMHEVKVSLLFYSITAIFCFIGFFAFQF